MMDDLEEFAGSLLRLGTMFGPGSLADLCRKVPPVRGTKRPRGRRKMANKQCFKNAARTVFESIDLLYVEGYAMSTNLFIPMHHAWCVDLDGNVVDMTWKDPETCWYAGWALTPEELFAGLENNGFFYGLVRHEHQPLPTNILKYLKRPATSIGATA